MRVPRIITIYLLVFVTAFVMQSCTKKCGTAATKLTEFDYNTLYQSEPVNPYAVVAAGETNKAQYGYCLMAKQGYNNWYYMFKNENEYCLMEFENGEWRGNGAIMNGPLMRPTAHTAAVRRFDIKKSGDIVVYGNYKCNGPAQKGGTITIYKNDTQIYSGEILDGDTDGKYFEVALYVSNNDCLYFCVEGTGDILLNPVITYNNSQNESLYHLTAIGKYYGDVFPYYDDENSKLYMGFLWSDDCRICYHNALEVSDNMIYLKNIPEENNYDLWRKYNENGRLHLIHDANKYIDHEKYKWGVRDNMVYFDEENERYLMIGGCYYRLDSEKQTSDLVIYSSRDKMGLSWEKDGNVVEAGYNRNLPECPQLLKIGNRWYVFVSVAYNTVHQVGPLQYWTGDEGVDCMDVDWSTKDFAFLDGEDLCAARPIKVKDKVYMWGWIPNLYNGMPWSPWGGYLNLPREVIQHSDGSLGGRLDEGLAKLLNYGNIYTLDSNNFNVCSGAVSFNESSLATDGESLIGIGTGYSRNYITYTVNMKNNDKCGYIMKQNNNEYQTVIEKECGKTYLRVRSPNDKSHKLNSYIEIQDTRNGIFDVQIIVDGDIIEFFVNNEYALTAHTAMVGTSYDAYLYSSASAEFKNVKINKLISYADLE